MNTHILSAITGEPVAVRFAMVGKGKAVHYSTDNDDTLCGKGVSRYVDGDTDAALCKPCARIERVRSEEYMAWMERHTVPAVMADWERELIANNGSLSVEPSPVMCQDCLTNAATIFDTDAPMCEACCTPDSASLGDESTGGENGAHTDAQTVSGGTVEIQGPEGFDMIPDMAELAGGCYFECGRPVTGMWCDYVGRTEGVCDLDRDKLGDHITVLPVDPAIWGGASETGTAVVGIVQNTPGMNGATHYHAPGCRDITREMRRYGQSQRDALEFTFSSVAEILTFEYGDIASNNAEENTPEWWANILENAQYDRSTEYGGMGVKIMPCLSIPMGTDNDGNPLQDKGSFYCFGFRQPSAEKVAEIQAEIAAHNFNTCDEKECVTCAVKLYDACKGNHTGDNVCAACDAFENARVIPATDNDSDAGFVETMVTKEYELSVIVDETTGTRVSLGWVTLEMNAAQCMDFDRVAEEYGRTQNTRTPRHGWASIITVHDVCDV